MWELPYKCHLISSHLVSVRAHRDEVLDVTFDLCGLQLATASTDGIVCVCSVVCCVCVLCVCV